MNHLLQSVLWNLSLWKVAKIYCSICYRMLGKLLYASTRCFKQYLGFIIIMLLMGGTPLWFISKDWTELEVWNEGLYRHCPLFLCCDLVFPGVNANWENHYVIMIFPILSLVYRSSVCPVWNSIFLTIHITRSFLFFTD